jgi:hypothetical protein
MDKDQKSALFWDIATPLLLSGSADKGTMMGFPCLRTNSGQFFASLEKDSADMIVKLPAPRVKELIEAGDARPFAPNGRTFREWALIPDPDEARWRALLEEARQFVIASKK